MDPFDAVASELHAMLLRLAGRAPDYVVTEGRTLLAEGRSDRVARLVVRAGTRQKLPLTQADLYLLDDLLANTGEGTRELEILQPDDSDERQPWRFAESSVESDDHPGDTAMIEAMATETAARGLYRAWRYPAEDRQDQRAKAVYVVEADDPDVLPAMTGRLQATLSDAGEPEPQVEVVLVASAAPNYQQLACVYGAALWRDTSEPKISVARVYDKVDPVTGPEFAPDHPLIFDLEERLQILEYLESGEHVLLALGTSQDVVEPSRGSVVPMSFLTDGTWVWTETVTYYLREHLLAPDPGLVRHALSADPDEPRSEVDANVLRRVMAALS